jgi:hypothetical protein
MKTNARIWIWIVLLLVVVVSVLVISKSKKETDDKMGKNIEYNTIELMQNEEIDLPTEVVIKNSEEWNQYFGNEASAVDFTKNMVFGYSLGARSNSGYSISVDSVTEDSSSITINATSITPGENCITMQVITFPGAFISINKTTKDVKWKIETVIEDC